MVATADLVVRVLTDTSKAAGDLGDVGKQSGKMSGAIKSAALPAAAALAALGAAAFAAGNAAAEDAQAAAVLAGNLKTAANATDAQVAATESFIDATAKATGVADDQLRPAMSQLALATGDVETSQSALTAALDASVATGTDVESVAKAIAKAYGGSTASLGKLIPSLDKATLASGDMTAIMADLADKTGGAAANAADTTAGKMARMQVAMDEAQEEIGSALLPALTALAGVLASVAGFAQAHPKLFIAIAAAVGIMAVAILALNVAVGIYTAVTTLAASATVMAWVAALWPILLVVAAVAAVVAIVIILWKHSETFRDIVLGVWAAIKKAATVAWDAIKDSVLAVFNWVKSHWPLLLAIITGPIGLAVLAIVKNWDTIKATANTVFAAVKTAVGWVSSALDTMIGWIKKIDFPDMDKPFTLAKTAIGHVSDAIDTMVGWLGKIVIPGGMSTPFDAMKTAVGAVSSAVESLINWLKKIPKVHIPHIPGTGSGRAAPATAARSVAAPGVAPPRGAVTSRAAAPVVINVTGALDPEAVARQIRRILAGHDRRVGLVT